MPTRLGQSQTPFSTIFILLVLSVCAVIAVSAIAAKLADRKPSPIRESYRDTGGEAPIVLSLTTSPQRLPHIRETLDHLYLKQTLRPDAIELNLPHVFKRNGSEYDLSQVPYRDRPFLHINRCEDLGPITKFVPTLQKYQDLPQALIIVVDDDIRYPPTLVEELVRAARRNLRSIVTGHCLSGYYTRNDGPCDLLEGYMSYLLRPGLFDLPDFESYLEVALRSQSCVKGDDYVLSNYVLLRGIPVLKLQLPALHKVVPLDFGLQPDALHKQVSVPERERYCGCYTDLLAMGVGAPLESVCGTAEEGTV